MCPFLIADHYPWFKSWVDYWKLRRPRSIFTNLENVEPTPHRSTALARPRKPMRSRRKGSVPQDVGPRTLDLFEEIYQNFQESSALQLRIDAGKQNVIDSQGFRDHCECNLLHIESDARLNLAEYTQEVNNGIHGGDNEKAAFVAELETMQARMLELEVTKEELWNNFYDSAYDYFNVCLDAAFGAPWSLSEGSCRSLREIVDQHHLILHTKSDIGHVSWNRTDVLNTQHRMERERPTGQSRLPSGLAQSLDQARRERLDESLRRVESEIRSHKELLQLREDFHRKNRDWFIRVILERQLKQAGRTQNETPEANTAPGNREQSGEHTETRPKINDAATPSGVSDGGISNESTVNADELQGQYVEMKERLEEIRGQYEAKQERFRRKELDHLLTFTNSSHHRFEAIVANKVRSEAEALGLVERDLVAMRQRLIRSGIGVPRSPDPPLGNVTGGGKIRRSSSRSSRSHRSAQSPISPTQIRRKRRAIDEWRIGTDGAKSKTPPSPGRSTAESDALQPPSRSSKSASPFPERDEYRRPYREDYRKYQKKLRRERGVASS